MPLLLLAGFTGLGLGAGIFRFSDEAGDAVKSAVPLIVGAGVLYVVARSQKWI